MNILSASRPVLITALVALVLSACGGGPRWQAPSADELLIPEISADGTKFFVFQRNYHRPQPATVQTPVDPSRRQQLPIGEYDVTERIDNVLLQTEYCRTGFFELYREQGLQHFEVRGECREAATEEDRQRYDGPLPVDSLAPPPQ